MRTGGTKRGGCGGGGAQAPLALPHSRIAAATLSTFSRVQEGSLIVSAGRPWAKRNSAAVAPEKRWDPKRAASRSASREKVLSFERGRRGRLSGVVRRTRPFPFAILTRGKKEGGESVRESGVAS